MNENQRLLNAAIDKLNQTILSLSLVRSTINITSASQPNMETAQLRNALTSIKLLSETVDSMNVSMRSMNDLIEPFNATFQPRSPSNRTGLDLIASTQNILQNMSVSLQSFSASVRIANSQATILPKVTNDTQQQSFTGLKAEHINAFNSLNGVVSNPALIPSLNEAIQFQVRALAHLNEMRVFINTTN